MSKDRDPRFVDIEGALNLRDFGGYETEDGGRIKKGKLFRCGALAQIPGHAHPDFAALDIGVICDLRDHEEISRDPTPKAAPFDCQVHIPISPGSAFAFKASFSDETKTAEHRFDFMLEITKEIARDHTEEYKTLFSQLLNAERGFLLHCSAGKDRTGFGAAMIQLMLGVSLESVFEDYLLTNHAKELADNLQLVLKKHHGGTTDIESMKIIAGVREEYLHAALETIDEHHGGLEDYWHAAGMDDNARSKLKSLLVEY